MVPGAESFLVFFVPSSSSPSSTAVPMQKPAPDPHVCQPVDPIANPFANAAVLLFLSQPCSQQLSPSPLAVCLFGIIRHPGHVRTARVQSMMYGQRMSVNMPTQTFHAPNAAAAPKGTTVPSIPRPPRTKWPYLLDTSLPADHWAHIRSYVFGCPPCPDNL